MDVSGPQSVPYCNVATVVTYLTVVFKFFLFWRVSHKWLDGFNSNLACACNWFSGCALFISTSTTLTKNITARLLKFAGYIHHYISCLGIFLEYLFSPIAPRIGRRAGSGKKFVSQ